MRIVLLACLLLFGKIAGAQICFSQAYYQSMADSLQMSKDDFFKPKTFDTVIVGATRCWKRCRVSGYCIKRDTIHATKELAKAALIKPVVLKNNIKTYPNPVPPGNEVTIFMQTKQMGPYIVFINNAAGLLVLKTQGSLQGSGQKIKFQTDRRWSRGMYYARVVGSTGGLPAETNFIIE